MPLLFKLERCILQFYLLAVAQRGQIQDKERNLPALKVSGQAVIEKYIDPSELFAGLGGAFTAEVSGRAC